MTGLKSRKIAGMKVHIGSIVVLLLLTLLIIPGRAADLKPAGISKEHQPSVAKSIQHSSAVMKGDAKKLKSEIQGTLKRVGNKVSLRLNRPADRVEVFSGNRNLAVLGSGIVFNVTPYVTQTRAKGLTFVYFRSGGRKSRQTIAPGKIKTLSRGISPESPKMSASTPSGSGRILKAPSGKNSVNIGTGKPALAQKMSSNPGLPKKNPGALTFTHPHQGDFMVEGSQFVLQWSGVGKIEEKCVNLDLFQGLSHVMPIAGNVCVNGYNWQLPQGVSGNNYKVRLRTIDNALMDDSDPFPILSAKPDLLVTNLHIQPSAPDMADSITVSGVIQNSGHGTSAATSAVVRLQSVTWSVEETLNIPSLSFGPNAHQPFSITFDPVAVTELTATIELDVQNKVAESSEANNEEQLVFPVIRLPNLKVCVNEEIFNTLGRTSIPILVKNYSFEPVGPSICRVWVKNHGSVNHNVPALGPFESYRFSRRERFNVAGWRSYSATIDYGDAVREFNEEDNIATGRIHASGVAGSHPVPQPNCN